MHRPRARRGAPRARSRPCLPSGALPSPRPFARSTATSIASASWATKRSWSNHARGLRYDGDERLIQFYLPCRAHARHGLIFLLRAIAKGDLDTFTAHLESAQPIGQRTADSIADMKARVDTAWDRGLRTGYLRLRVGSGGQGVLGPAGPGPTSPR